MKKIDYITSELEKQIRGECYPAGSALPSAHQLANEFKVSYLTAYNAVSRLVEKKLIFRLNGKGSFVAVQHKETTNRTLGILWGTRDNFLKSQQSIFYKEILSGINAAAANLHLSIRHIYIDELIIDSLKDINGLISTSSIWDSPQNKILLNHINCRHIYLGMWHPPLGFCNCLNINIEQAFEKMLKYMIEHEFRHIGLIYHGPENRNWGPVFNRIKTELGLPVTDNWVIKIELSGDFEQAKSKGKKLAMKTLEKYPELDGFISLSDHVAAGLIQAAATVKKRIGIIGMDNIEGFGYLPLGEPTITSISPPYFRLGQQAVEMVNRKLQDGDEYTHTFLKPEIVARKSCGEQN